MRGSSVHSLEASPGRSLQGQGRAASAEGGGEKERTTGGGDVRQTLGRGQTDKMQTRRDGGRPTDREKQRDAQGNCEPFIIGRVPL